VVRSGHKHEGLFQFLQSRSCRKQNNVVPAELRPQNTRDQMPHAVLTREVFILSCDMPDVRVVIQALCVVVTEVNATCAICSRIVC
jgi:hypothetical protein